MKALKILSVTLSTVAISLTLTGCGGGGSNSVAAPSSTSNPPATTPPATSDTGKLIIDNGRGTSNNQDTERPK